MKKLICTILSLIVIFSFTSCYGGADNRTAGTNQKTVGDVLNNMISSSQSDTSADSTASTDVTAIARAAEGDTSGDFDVDLTQLSSTMVYSEVYNMVTEPDKYKGKTIKMQGPFAVYRTDDKDYFACIIADATACCSQGLEFRLDGDFKYPDDYPAEGTVVTVTGTFNTYNEGEAMYCELIDAQMSL